MPNGTSGNAQALLDTLARFSFGGHAVPVESWSIVGGIRDHVHEYSHQDGGDPEKLGRSLYTVRAMLNMQSTFALYPDLWPSTLSTLVSIWESGATEELVVPSVGPIQAYAKGWTREWTYKLRSGEKVNVEFREDKSNLPRALFISGTSPNALDTSASAVEAAKARANGLTQGDQDLLTSLQSLVNAIVGIRDTAFLEGNLIIQRCSQLIALCQQIDALPSLQDPTNVALMRALHDLWLQAQAFANDAQGKNQVLQVWIVPVEMSIARISTAIFGDATHVSDLLALNSGAFNDPQRIRAGTEIAYYPTSQNAST